MVSSEYPRMEKHPETHQPMVMIAPNTTDDGRTAYGMKWAEVMKLARHWWRKKGRLEMSRLPGDFRDPDVGFDSGITLARHWGDLTTRERVRVMLTYEETILRERSDVRQALREYMLINHPQLLDQAELARYVAAAPNVDDYVDKFTRGG